jgi:Fic family protein
MSRKSPTTSPRSITDSNARRRRLPAVAAADPRDARAAAAGGARRQQASRAVPHQPVFVGGVGARAHFIPPPPDALDGLLAGFEQFLHADHRQTPPLVKAALAHVQFETIHPFSDGNGRLGRLLIALILCHEGVLREPSLYLSLYLKRRRADYYERLNAVRTQGDWEGWLGFFLDGVAETAGQAVDTAQRLLALLTRDRARIDFNSRRFSVESFVRSLSLAA